jgi:hypothetical protein
MDKMDKGKLISIFWEYRVNCTGDDIYDFLVGKKEIKEFNRNRVIARILTSMRWYDLVDIFGIKQIYGFLTDDVIAFIWKKSLKTRFRNARVTFQGVI